MLNVFELVRRYLAVGQLEFYPLETSHDQRIKITLNT